MRLGEREQDLVDRHPDVAWDGPNRVSVPGELTRLTCRYCTALYGPHGCRPDATRSTFFTREDWAKHIVAEHHEPEEEEQ